MDLWKQLVAIQIRSMAHATILTTSVLPVKESTTSIASAPDSFHVYKLEWTPFVLNWYVDDVKFYSYGNPGSGAAAWHYTSNFFMILNVAVGGNFGGQQGVDGNAFPQQMQVDYVRAYQKK